MLGLFQSALIIFSLRVVDITLYTMRIMMVVRGRKSLAWVFAFFQSIFFIGAIRAVLTGLDNWWNIIGYAAGFATGNVVGMIVEGRLAVGYTHVRILSPTRGAELVERLRAKGYAVTELSGRGRDGSVDILNCSVLRRDNEALYRLVAEVDEQAFVTAEDVRLVWQGFWHSPPRSLLERLRHTDQRD